jgi:hypothetical protein
MTKMEFDLSRYGDFALAFPGHETADDYTYQLLNPGIYSVTIKGEESMPCELTFSPTEVWFDSLQMQDILTKFQEVIELTPK